MGCTAMVWLQCGIEALSSIALQFNRPNQSPRSDGGPLEQRRPSPRLTFGERHRRVTTDFVELFEQRRSFRLVPRRMPCHLPSLGAPAQPLKPRTVFQQQ